MLTDQLKQQTLSNHQQLEKLLVGRMRAMRTVDAYVALLGCFYRYYGALEDHIRLFIGSSELPDHHQRRKSESIANDILFLGGVLPEKAGSAEVPYISNVLQAFGALYVMEGSTLGGQIISTMISKQLGIDDRAITFFQSYGDQLHTMWDTFKMALNRQATNLTEEAIIIATANQAFICFKNLLEA